jgi:hypothetical protein
VRQHLLAVDVPDGVDVGHVGPHHRIDGDDAVLDRDADRLQPDVLDVALAADSYQQYFRFQSLFLVPVVFYPHSDTRLGDFDVLRRRARGGEDGDILAAEGAGEHLGGFLFLGGNDTANEA